MSHQIPIYTHDYLVFLVDPIPQNKSMNLYTM